MEKKMTKKEMFAMVLALVESVECENKQEMVDFLNHEIELLNNKKSSSAKTKTQIENEKIMAEIVEELAKIGRPVTISEMQEASEVMKTYSNQKLSALLKHLIEKEQRVVKTIDKKKSYFSLAEEI